MRQASSQLFWRHLRGASHSKGTGWGSEATQFINSSRFIAKAATFYRSGIIALVSVRTCCISERGALHQPDVVLSRRKGFLAFLADQQVLFKYRRFLFRQSIEGIVFK